MTSKRPPQNRRKPQPPGADAELVKHCVTGFSKPAIDTTDPAAVEQRTLEYLNQCVIDDCLPSVAGLAYWLNVSTREIQYWHTGQRGSKEHKRIIGRFYNVLEDIWHSDMMSGNIPPTAGIFTGKAYFHLRDN